MILVRIGLKSKNFVFKKDNFTSLLIKYNFYDLIIIWFTRIY